MPTKNIMKYCIIFSKYLPIYSNKDLYKFFKKSAFIDRFYQSSTIYLLIIMIIGSHFLLIIL